MEILWHIHALKTNYSPKKINDKMEKELALLTRKLKFYLCRMMVEKETRIHHINYNGG